MDLSLSPPFASSSTPSPPFTTNLSKSSPFTLFPQTSKRPFTRRAILSLRATLTVDSPPAADASGSGIPKVLLEVRNLRAVIAESKQEILRGVNLTINEGEVHAIMGKNGSGKSTFSKVLVGHPDYEVTEGRVVFKGQNLLELDPEERSHAGLFMSFQTTIEIPGVSNMDFLLMAVNAKRKKHGQPELSPLEVLEADLAILDENDSMQMYLDMLMHFKMWQKQ